jgi:hypothetical protein
MSPQAGETGERSLARCERIALDFHIDEPLREDADRGTPQQHQADLRGDVRPQDEFAGGESDACGHDARTDQRPQPRWRLGQVSGLEWGQRTGGHRHSFLLLTLLWS